MKDQFERTVDYMRVSVTDRCNMRCAYCVADSVCEERSGGLLTFEEIERICRAASEVGIKKIKVTGGEPLLRKGVPELVGRLKAVPGIEQVTLTTNGSLLREHSSALISAGVDAVNVSLDSLRNDRFRILTGGGDLCRTLDGIKAIKESGSRTRINTVLIRNMNDDEIADLTDFALEHGVDIRFIELMPMGPVKINEGVSGGSVIRTLRMLYPNIEKDKSLRGNGPAEYYRVPGQKAAVGIISAVSRPFCSSCNRIRLTSSGYLKACLCYEEGLDLRPFLSADEKGNKNGKLLSKVIGSVIWKKPKMHCFQTGRSADTHSMSQIGG